MIDHDALSHELFAAVAEPAPVPLLTQRHPELTWDDARAVARGVDALRREAGQHQVGWKLGWTSQAMRTALGIDRPNWGTLWAEQVIEAPIDLNDFIHPKIEPELVWRSPEVLSGEISASDVAEVGGEWALGIEVVDPRFATFEFDALDNTADNSSSAAVRVGEFVALDRPLDDLMVEFDDGGEHRSGPGSQAMGSPWEAVAWLVRELHDEGGLRLEPGHIVFTGGLTAPFDVASGQAYTLSSSDLPTVTLRVDADG